ncbi:MAG: hypothetical protein DMG24_15285 [Acidobacteria bacterium]|nr:MAG: hypothetical protein DMG24_15285 [Acidobacteriota bacterium]
MQIDLRRLEKADDAEEPEWFAELLKKVDIGEIWPPGGSTLPAAKPPRRATEQSGGNAWR